MAIIKGDLPEFTKLLEPIHTYLANAPHVTEEQLAAARDAYNTLIAIIYGQFEPHYLRCSGGIPRLGGTR